MKFRRRRSPLLLLLIPSFAALLVSATADNKQSVQKNSESREPEAGLPSAVILSPLKPTSKVTIGTKDAPVDGKDGKPHAGPFVDDEKDRKKPKTTTEDSELVLEAKPPIPKTHIDPSIPEINDGVMDDPSRELPKKGSTGTAGGISEKDKARKAQEGQTGEKAENKPASPKEAPPLPHSEQERIQEEKDAATKADKESTKKTKGKDSKGKDSNFKTADPAELGGLEKPKDLPGKPHDAPHPVPISANKDHLDVSKPQTSVPKSEEEEPEGIIQPLHSYLLSLTMILVSEVGDKTFLIAALMAMKHDRLLVFSAAFSALIAMTVLSAVLGHALPTLLPQRFTNFLAAVLFLFFGAKLMREGLAMSPTEGVAAEMQEVEMELEEKEHQARQQGRRRSSISPYALEMGLGRGNRKSRSGSRLPSPPRSPLSSRDGSPSPNESSLRRSIAGFSNLLSLLLSPAWVQTFVMTFLGEWGDRSQIATIAMAAGQDYWWVTGGAISGHAVCTGVAVIGGRAIAGRVSLRVVTLGGAVAFIVFGVIYLVEAMYHG